MPAKKNLKTFYALSLAWQLGFIIALPIGAFLFFGFWADQFFKTQPLFLILGFFIGLIITVCQVYYLLIPLIKNKEKSD